MNRKTNFTTT